MPSWSKPVFSTMVNEVGWEGEDLAAGTLIVKWNRGGKVSAYDGVPEHVADQLAKAPSVGNMINNEIKGQYSHRYV